MEEVVCDHKIVIAGFHKEAQQAAMSGDANKAIYTIGQMALEDPNSCSCSDWGPVDKLPEDHWVRWLHHNHHVYNATVWKICNSVRPGFIRELADALRVDLARQQPFFMKDYSQAMLDGFFTEDPVWLGPYRPSAKKAV